MYFVHLLIAWNQGKLIERLFFTYYLSPVGINRELDIQIFISILKPFGSGLTPQIRLRFAHLVTLNRVIGAKARKAPRVFVTIRQQLKQSLELCENPSNLAPFLILFEMQVILSFEIVNDLSKHNNSR